MTNSSSITERIRLTNKFGLHLRASAKLAHLAGQYDCSIYICHEGKNVNAKSLLNIIALGVHDGVELEIKTEGEGAEDALKAVLDLINRKFGGERIGTF